MDYPKSVPGVGLVNGKFADEDAASGRVGSLIPSAWGNGLTDEALAVIQHAGLAPSEADLTQLLQAILAVLRGSTAGAYVIDTGAANAYAVAYTPAVTALVDGMALRFRAKTANTAASTLAVNGLPAKPIVGGGHVALAGGEIVAGGICEVEWSAVLSAWVLRGCTGGALQVGAATQANHAAPLSTIAGKVDKAGGQMAGPLQLAGGDTGTTAAQFDDSVALSTTAFVKRASGSLRGYVVYTAAAALTTADVGKLIVTASNAFTLTLVNPTTVPAGTALYIHNDNANTVTLSTPSGIFYGAVGTGTASIALYPAEFMVLFSDGTSWRAEDSSSRAQTQAAGTNDTRKATTAFVQAAIAALGISTLINNSGAASDLSLAIGQSAYIDVAGLVSVALRIAVADQQLYEIILHASGQGTGSTSSTLLLPNNTTYTNCFEQQQFNVQAGQGFSTGVYVSGFSIGRGDPRISRALASIRKGSKTVFSNSTSNYSGNITGVEYAGNNWVATAGSPGVPNTTTDWTSLGTVTFPTAWTGRIIIRRIY